MDDLKLVVCPYLPLGFVALEDSRGFVIIDLNKMSCFRVPKMTLETVWGREVKFTETGVEGTIECKVTIEK